MPVGALAFASSQGAVRTVTFAEVLPRSRLRRRGGRKSTRRWLQPASSVGYELPIAPVAS